MNKKQQQFWDLLRKDYPPEPNRSCENCMYSNNDGLSQNYRRPHIQVGVNSKICDRCRQFGDDDFHTVWKWNGQSL